MISTQLNTVKQASAIAAMGIALALPLSSRAADAFQIVTDFPGGNVHVEKIEDTKVSLSPDLRDNASPWFYWYFGVKGAEGKTLQFALDPSKIGVRGPGVSRDGGETWEWLGADAVEEGVFSYSFPKEPQEIRFSVGMPYVAEDFERFFKTHAEHPDVIREPLTQSRKGRAVPLVRISKANRKSAAPYAIVMTARHHACEMMASYALEGAIDGILADTHEGTWLRENVDFFIVPIVDFDGVTDGDQGKNRAPHDHNRDYVDELYPEIAAIKKRVPEWLDGRPFIFMDFHDPTLRGAINTKTYFLDSPHPRHATQLARFLTHLERVHQGSLPCDQEMVMRFGQAYNKKPLDPPRYSRAWALQFPHCLFGATLELPYATASDSEVNAESARAFGRDLARGYQAYLNEQPAPSMDPVTKGE